MTFFVVLFAIIEGGRFINVQQVVTNAAREGARLSVAPFRGTSILPTPAEIEAEVGMHLDAANITGATISVERPVIVMTGPVAGEFTRVRVQVPYRVISMAMFSDLEVTLSGEALMRNETSP
jgi:hypothetical protein